MMYYVSQLNDETISYLENASQSPQSPEYPGVLIRRMKMPFSDPRSGWLALILIGLLCFAFAILFVCLSLNSKREMILNQSILIAITFGVGLTTLLTGIARFHREHRGPTLGNFIFADAARVWQVNGDVLRTYEFDTDLVVDGYDYTQNGRYVHTEVKINTSRFGPKSWQFRNQALATRFFEFIKLISLMRRSDDENTRALAATGSGKIALQVERILDQTPESEPWSTPVNPPQAKHKQSDEGVPEVGWSGTIVRGFVAVVSAFLVGLIANYTFDFIREAKLFAEINNDPSPSTRAIDAYLAEYTTSSRSGYVRELRDDRLFAAIPKSIVGNQNELYPISFYLGQFPNGRHAAEVRKIRDDHTFAVAKNETVKLDSPASLRNYLADEENTRHRADAQKLIAGYYDRTVNDLKNRAEKLKQQAKKDDEQIDPKLINFMITLIESLKTADNPVLTVGFTPTIEAEPKEADVKKSEEAAYRFHLSNGEHKHELIALELKSPNKTAIIPHGDTFTEKYVESREDMIFQRLSEAITRGIKSDILTLRRAHPDEKPNLEVQYRVFPAGYVIPFQEVDDDDSYKRMLGLIRVYFTDWKIVYRKPDNNSLLEYRTESRPGNNLLYRMEPNDPDWAIYAVSQYSAFYGLSDKMIRSLGQDPGKMPDAFTWAGTSSFKNDRKPINFGAWPKLNLDFLKPKLPNPKLP